MNDPSMQVWLLARTSGILAYVLLTLGVIAGLTIKSRMFGRTVPTPVMVGIHQLFSTLGLAGAIVHAGLLIMDTKVDIPLLAAVIPGLSPYRTVATALGVVAIELWVLIHFSFAIRKYIGVRRWRSLHKLTFGVWALAAIHGLSAGSDSGLAWMQNIYAISAALVVGLTAWRILSATPRAPQRPPAALRSIPHPREDENNERHLSHSPGPIAVQRHG